MKILSICVTVLAFGVIATGNAKPPAIITEADSGHLVALGIGQELVLNPKSNPLGVAKDVPVGFKQIRLKISLNTDATASQQEKLLALTERYCVV